MSRRKQSPSRSERSYLAASLQPGETVLRVARIHSAYLLGPGVASATLILVMVSVFSQSGIFRSFYWSPVLLLVPLAYFLQFLVAAMSTEVALTDRRVLAKTGLVSRNVAEILLARVESVATQQGIIGRLFDFGNLEVRGTGGAAVKATGIAGVMEFRAAVQNSAPA